ncbi:Bug family tripartite tricarboxylate transporter substrate binding protein [Polynucleobacter sinensis]|uniref:Bug family tripartite tricarboxylate transporter substrate binding protein n=1 Tax=Polynucleobacter sinensis TaxID=1743157 RepID=UPI0009EDEC6C|nr:tripartite tricarboxylate transporter substrate-binding protein [Polynucleobacter sinensis]
MNLNKITKRYLYLFVGILIAAFQGSAHGNEIYPSKPVKIIIPVSAGGSTDRLARLVAEKLSVTWKQPVIVENMTGAGGAIGAAYVAKSKPDGYTLLLHSDAVVLNLALIAKPSYSLSDLTGVVKVAANPQILVVRPGLGVTTLKEYADLVRSKPGIISVGLPTNGGIGHISHEMLRKALQLNVNYIPYPGGGPAALAVMGDHVDATMITTAAVTEFIKAKKLVPIAVTTSYRSLALPDVPTIAESGVPGFNVESWQGILAPAGTPKEIVRKINRDTLAILENPEFKKQVEAMGYGVSSGSPEQFTASLNDELKRYTQVIKEAGITLK